MRMITSATINGAILDQFPHKYPKHQLSVYPSILGPRQDSSIIGALLQQQHASLTCSKQITFANYI